MSPLCLRYSTSGRIPQERYDIFMNNFTERTWMGVVMEQELKKIMATYVKYPPRKLQSFGYTGPITISNYERFQWVRESARKGRCHHRAADRKLIDLGRRPGIAGLPAVPTLIAGGEKQCWCHVISRRPRAPSLFS